MKMRVISLLCVGLITSQVYAAEGQAPLSEQDKLSYAIGADIGNNFKNQNIEINSASLTQGLNDAINGKELVLSQAEVEKTLQTFQTQLLNKRQAQMMHAAEQNQQAGEKFLAENKTKPGVITLASGLQYKVIQAGNGAKPTEKDTVMVEYTGRLLDGKVFDSSVEHGGKVSFKVNEVIPGWQEALKLMPVGSTWEIYIPAALAYGENGAGHLIEPNSTLIFNLHLLEIGSDKSADANQATSK